MLPLEFPCDCTGSIFLRRKGARSDLNNDRNDDRPGSGKAKSSRRASTDHMRQKASAQTTAAVQMIMLSAAFAMSPRVGSRAS
jgi:hypothetical protein